MNNFHHMDMKDTAFDSWFLISFRTAHVPSLLSTLSSLIHQVPIPSRGKMTKTSKNFYLTMGRAPIAMRYRGSDGSCVNHGGLV